MTRFVTRVVLAALFVTACSSTALAQAQKGDKEILLFGNLFVLSGGGSTQTVGIIFTNVGVFISDSLEVGGGPTITVAGGAGSTTTVVGVNGFVRKSFVRSNPKIAPYVGAEISIQDLAPEAPQGIGDVTFINAIGGLKNYFSERAALDIKGNFGFLLTDPGLLKIFGFTVGLTVLF
jgi:hypothetical protein